MPETGYQVLSSEREEEVHFQFTPNVARSKCFKMFIFHFKEKYIITI